MDRKDRKIRVDQQITLMLQTQLRLWDDMKCFEALTEKFYSNLSAKISEYASNYDGFLVDDEIIQFLSELEEE